MPTYFRAVQMRFADLMPPPVPLPFRRIVPPLGADAAAAAGLLRLLGTEEAAGFLSFDDSFGGEDPERDLVDREDCFGVDHFEAGWFGVASFEISGAFFHEDNAVAFM